MKNLQTFEEFLNESVNNNLSLSDFLNDLTNVTDALYICQKKINLDANKISFIDNANFEKERQIEKITKIFKPTFLKTLHNLSIKYDDVSNIANITVKNSFFYFNYWIYVNKNIKNLKSYETLSFMIEHFSSGDKIKKYVTNITGKPNPTAISLMNKMDADTRKNWDDIRGEDYDRIALHWNSTYKKGLNIVEINSSFSEDTSMRAMFN